MLDQEAVLDALYNRTRAVDTNLPFSSTAKSTGDVTGPKPVEADVPKDVCMSWSVDFVYPRFTLVNYLCYTKLKKDLRNVSKHGPRWCRWNKSQVKSKNSSARNSKGSNRNATKTVL